MRSRKFTIGPTLMDNGSGGPVIEVKFYDLSTPQVSSFLENAKNAGKDARAYAIVRDLADLKKSPPVTDDYYMDYLGHLLQEATQLVDSPTLEYDYVSFAHFVWLVKRLIEEPQSPLMMKQVEAVIKEFEAKYGTPKIC